MSGTFTRIARLLGLGILVVAMIFTLSGCDDFYDEAASESDLAETTMEYEDAGDEEVKPAEDTSDDESSNERETAADETDSNAPEASGGISGADADWLVMLYMDADDSVLEKDIFIDLNEAEKVGSTDRVHIVAQIDRDDGAFKGDGNWKGTRRYYLTQDSDLSKVESELIEDLGEADMAQKETLGDFATWAIENYPARKVMLIMSDHGAGWVGGYYDPEPGGDDQNHMSLETIAEALGEIQGNTGIDKLELVGFDACLMGQLEVFSALVPYAKYAIASQEVEPSMGCAYHDFLTQLTENPEMGGGDLAGFIVDSYIVNDIRIVDDNAWSVLAQEMYGTKNISAEEAATDFSSDVTLSAVDLSKMPVVLTSLDEMSYQMSRLSNQKLVASARTHARSFTSIFGDDEPESYIDLGNFAKLIEKKVDKAGFTKTVNTLQNSIKEAVIAEKHGSDKKGSTGIAIYFPNSDLYEEEGSSAEEYIESAKSFAELSLWDEFLAFHYTGEEMPATNTRKAIAPTKGVKITAPGAEKLVIDEITISANVATQDKPVTLSTEIRGEDIGFIYTFVGYYDSKTSELTVVDSDYLEGDATREIDGVYYPDWTDNAIVPIEFDWEPTLYAISDGKTSAIAQFAPEDYGAAGDDATYSVDGIYTFADSGETMYAVMYFKSGEMTGVFGFNGNATSTGAPRQITPEAGDQFTVLMETITEDITMTEGETLTFGDENFYWEEVPAQPGQYLLGFIAEDLNGNTYEEYVPVEVE